MDAYVRAENFFLIPSNKRNVFILIVTCNYYSGWLLVILDPNGSVLITLKCDLTTHKNIALLLFLWWASYPEGRDKVRFSLSCATFFIDDDIFVARLVFRGWASVPCLVHEVLRRRVGFSSPIH